MDECYEVDPFTFSDQFKSKLTIINPFQRIHKEINELFLELKAVDEIKRKDFEKEIFNGEKFEKMVKDYYDYKIQYKKYGVTFYIIEEDKKSLENNYVLVGNDRELFVNKSYSNDLSDFLNFDRYELSFDMSCKKYDLVTLEKQKMISDFQLGKKVIKYIDPERLYKIKRTKETLLSLREIINLNRIKEIPYLFKYENFKSNDDDEEYDYYRDLKQSIEDSPETSYNKKDFIKMLNIMYEDQYLDDFNHPFYSYQECYDYYQKDYKEKYLEEFTEIRSDFKDYGGDEDYYDMIGGDYSSLKDYKMSSRFGYIETKNVVYGLEDWEDINSYRRIIIFDPINNNYFVPIDEQIDELYCIRKIV